MNREQKAIKDILADWQDYDKNLFHQSVKAALRVKELGKLKELGAATHLIESDLRLLQGEYLTLKMMQEFSAKHKEALLRQAG